MKESKFIDKNLKSWNEYENIISLKENKPEKLSKLFTKITDDLSYSYSNYNNRSVRVYLNSFAKLLFYKINQSEKFRIAKLYKFFSQQIPLAIYQARKEFYIATAVFALAMGIGILSSIYEPEFAQQILGNDYIKMTEANIAKNDPMAVYKSQAPIDMFFAITLNNCMVALRTFVFGFFMAIGTLLILLYNGVMVGAFQFFFIEQGLFKESFLTIWQHGVFEISSIIMSGAAGLVLGKGIIFPGNYSRFQSLRISARKGLKLLLGLLPILVIAGFIEGFFTRFTEAPDFVRIISILISFSVIVGYFIILPRYRNKNNPNAAEIEDNIEMSDEEAFSFDKIYTGAELFMFTFQSLKNNIAKIIKWSLLVGILFPLSLFILNYFGSDYTFSYKTFSPLLTIHESETHVILLAICFSLITFMLSQISIQSPHIEKGKLKPSTLFVQIAIVIGISHVTLLIPSPFLAYLTYIICLLFSGLIINTISIERYNFIQAIKVSFMYLKGNTVKFLSLSVRYAILTLLFYFVFFKLIAVLNNELIKMNLYGSDETSSDIMFYVNAMYYSTISMFAYVLMYQGMQMFFFTIHETYHATSLKNKLQSIGNTKRIRGILRE